MSLLRFMSISELCSLTYSSEIRAIRLTHRATEDQRDSEISAFERQLIEDHKLLRKSAFGVDAPRDFGTCEAKQISLLEGAKTVFAGKSLNEHLRHAICEGTWTPLSLADEVVAQLDKISPETDSNRDAIRNVIRMWESDGDGLLKRVCQEDSGKPVYIPDDELADALTDIRDNAFNRRYGFGSGEKKYAFIGEKYVMKILSSRGNESPPIVQPSTEKCLHELFKDYVLARMSAGKTNKTEFRFVFPRLLQCQSDAVDFELNGVSISETWIVILEPKVNYPFFHTKYPAMVSLIPGGWFSACHLEHEYTDSVSSVHRIVDALPLIVREPAELPKLDVRGLVSEGVPVPWQRLFLQTCKKVTQNVDLICLELVRWVIVYPQLQKGMVLWSTDDPEPQNGMVRATISERPKQSIQSSKKSMVRATLGLATELAIAAVVASFLLSQGTSACIMVAVLAIVVLVVMRLQLLLRR